MHVAIRDWLYREHSRWILWTPVAIALGILLNFHFHPLPEMLPYALIFSGAGAVVFWKRLPVIRVLLLSSFLIGIGMASAKWQTQRMQQSILSYQTGILTINANLQQVILDEDGKQKLLLNHIEIVEGRSKILPETIRLTLKTSDDRLFPGQRIQLRGGLFPLPAPALPGGFDFTRHFYFQGIGAVGFALAPVEILKADEQDSWRTELARFRQSLSQHISQILQEADYSEAVAAIAVALVTAERAAIPEGAREAMTAAGLAHMLAISGLHLGLVTGFFFLLIRYLLVMTPSLALRFQVKKGAAVGALLGGMAYLALADFPVSAQRAYVMVAFVLVAVLLNRQVLPMRSIAFAAIILLLLAPASILGPSFQLSFAATLAIIALYETWYKLRHQQSVERYSSFGVMKRIRLYVLGVLTTTFVASLMTAPFAVYHFNQFTLYHLLANIVAAPILSFLIMPSAVIAMLLIPLGLDGLFFKLMGQGIEWILHLAYWVQALPHSMLHVPTPPGWTIAMLSFGICWFCFWQERARWLGMFVILISLFPFFTTRLPDMLVSENAEQITVRLPDGQYAMLRGSQRNFLAGLWKEALGVESFTAMPKKMQQCDSLACRMQYKGKLVSLPKRRSVVAEECADADVVITDFYIPDCKADVLIVERPEHSVALTFTDECIIQKDEVKPFLQSLQRDEADDKKDKSGMKPEAP